MYNHRKFTMSQLELKERQIHTMKQSEAYNQFKKVSSPPPNNLNPFIAHPKLERETIMVLRRDKYAGQPELMRL